MAGALGMLALLGAGGCEPGGGTVVLPDAAADASPADVIAGDGADAVAGDGLAADARRDGVNDGAQDAPRTDGATLDAGGEDGGGSDLPTLMDTPTPDATGLDQGGPELPTPDAGGLGCTPESCPEGFGCVAKVCVARCQEGATLEDLVAALGPGVTPVSQVCTDTRDVYAWDVLSSWALLEVRATPLSNTSTSLALRKWPLFGQSGPSGASILSASTIPGSVTLWEVFPSPMLTVDEESGLALWGYTATGGATTADGPAAGAVFATPIAGGTTTTFPAVAPTGAVLRQGAALVAAQDVAGAGQGPGLYLLNLAGGLSTRVVWDLGSAPGYVSAWHGEVLLGGYGEQWPACDEGGDEAPGDRLFEATEDAIMTAYGAGTPLSAACDLRRLELAPDVRFLRDGRILERQSANGWDTDALLMHTWVRDGAGALTLATSRVLSEGPLFRAARGVGDAGLLVLQHEAGYLIVQGPGPMADPGPASPPDAVEVVEEPATQDAGGTADASGESVDEVLGDGGGDAAEAGPVPKR